MKYVGSYKQAMRRLNVTPLPKIAPIPKPLPPPPETRDAALLRLGEIEQKLILGHRDRNIIAEKMRLQTLLSTTLKRGPKPRVERPDFRPKDAPIPYVGPRCDFCGGEAPGGVCVGTSKCNCSRRSRGSPKRSGGREGSGPLWVIAPCRASAANALAPIVPRPCGV